MQRKNFRSFKIINSATLPYCKELSAFTKSHKNSAHWSRLVMEVRDLENIYLGSNYKISSAEIQYFHSVA
ncbi:hypothetical protein ACVWYG_000826 [Pedobacter sp. UYEF25]